MNARLLVLIVLFVLPLVGAAARPVVGEEQGFVPLFDGESLAGWKMVDGDAIFRVDDGCIVAEVGCGKCVSTSSSFQSSHYDLANQAPLKIGLGERDYFHGKLNDVRIYNRALNDADVVALHRAGR